MGLTPPNWTKTPKGKIAREMWAILKPDGEIVIGTDFESEVDAWSIATGWGDAEEIEQRKREGWKAVRAVLNCAKISTMAGWRSSPFSLALGGILEGRFAPCGHHHAQTQRH